MKTRQWWSSSARCFICGIAVLLLQFSSTPSLLAQTYLYGVATYATGNDPVAVVAADFNGDGQLDLAVANLNDSTVTVFLSQPNGTLGAGVTYNVGTAPMSIVAADFNGDGHPDLSTANNGSRNVSVLINNGDGTFQAAVPYAAGYQPHSIVAADFNGDKKTDLAVTNGGDNTVSVLLGNGDGTFQDQQATSVGAGPTALAAGDFNNDGKPDLVVADSAASGGQITVLLSNGDGTFTRKDSPVNAFLRASFTPSLLTVGDFNGDGKLDVVAAQAGENGLFGTILLGKGDGTFVAPTTTLPLAGTVGLGSADLNHDGKLDVIALGLEGAYTLLGNGDGTFQQPITAYLRASGNFFSGIGMALADMNGDGNADLVVTDPIILGTSLVYVALGNGDGTFSTSPTLSLGVDSSGQLMPTASVAADFNGDGKQDIATAVSTGGNQEPAAISVLLGNGNGAFQTAKVTKVPSEALVTLVGGDFNGDGKMDLAGTTAAGAGATLSVFLGNGDGTFQSPVNSSLPLAGSPLASGDFNGDGKTDLAVPAFDTSTGKASVQILLSSGSGTFTPGFQCDIAPNPTTVTAIQTGDFNKDGKLDLAVAAGDTVYVFIGNGNGTFTGPATYPVAFTGTNNPILGFTVGDFNGDGNPDLAVGGKPGLAVLPGTGTGSFGAPIYSTISGAGFQTAVAGDFNNDGKIDLAASGVLYLGKGDGTFTQSTAFLAGVAGFLTSADFNSDGVPDLATAGSGLTSSSPVATVYLAAAAANLAPSPPSFEQVPAGQSSPPQTVTLTNLGIVALSDLSVSTTGEFSQTSTCALSLNPSSQCQTEVTFAPAAAGPQSGALVVSDNALPNPQVVALSGTGTGPGIGLSPASLNFNVQEVGTPSAPQTLMVSNPGTAALTVSSIAASANYGATNTCTTAPVEAGSSCTVTVTFTPTASGALNGNITITSDANNQAGSTQTVPLTGTGSVVALSLSPTSLDLGSVIVGAASAAQTVTLTNTGTAALGITTIAASGDFMATNTCGTSVAVGGKCTITVTFKPSAGGSRTGALTLTDSAPGSPQTVTLDGAGEDFTLGAASGASTTASVSPGQPATYTLSLTGLGGITLPILFACTGAPAESTCSVSPASVTPGASAASVTVTVATTAPSIVVPPAPGGQDLRRMKLFLLGLLFFVIVGSFATRRASTPRRRRRAGLMAAGAALLLALAITACGGGGASSSGPSNPGTPTGSYPLSVTGTVTSGSTTVSHSVSLTLEIQ